MSKKNKMNPFVFQHMPLYARDLISLLISNIQAPQKKYCNKRTSKENSFSAENTKKSFKHTAQKIFHQIFVMFVQRIPLNNYLIYICHLVFQLIKNNFNLQFSNWHIHFLFNWYAHDENWLSPIFTATKKRKLEIFY